MKDMENFPGVIRVGRSTRRYGAQVVPGSYRVGIRTANTPRSFRRYPARAHGAIFATNTIFAELTVGRLLFVAVFPCLRTDRTGLLFQFSSVCLHLFDSSEVVWNIQSVPLLKPSFKTFMILNGFQKIIIPFIP
jgi:hypothetical protein